MIASAIVSVIDTSALIHVKELYLDLDTQQSVFRELTRLVKAGSLSFPSNVVEELSHKAEGDLPYLWAKNTHRYVKYDDAPFNYLRVVAEKAQKVVHGVILTVVDPRKTRHEDADPYVLAQALFIDFLGKKPIVVTKDRFDNPFRLSMKTACGLLDLSCEGLEPCMQKTRDIPLKWTG